MSRPNYDIFINGVEKQNIIWGSNNSRKYNYKLSYELTGSLTLFGSDALEIINADITTTYEVLITRNGSTWFTGSFRKIDCTIDEDDGSVEVSFKKEDDYTVIDDHINKEFDIIQDLGTPESVINYDAPAAIQFHIRHSEVVTTIVNGLSYDTNVGAYDYFGADLSLLNSSGFKTIDGFLPYVSGNIDNDDIEGAWVWENAINPNGWVAQKGTYRMTVDLVGKKLQIRSGASWTGTIEYEGTYTISPFGADIPDDASLVPLGYNGFATTLTDGAGGDVRVYLFPVLARVLTNETTFDGNPTTAIDNDTDIAPNSYLYQISLVDLGITVAPLIFSKTHQDTGQDQVPSGSLNDPGKFYEALGNKIIASKLYEIGIYYDGSIDLSTGNTDITLSHAYKVETILNKWFEWRGKTITVSFPHDLYLVPATNITVGKYDIAAKRGKTTLGEILSAISGCFRLDYHISAGIMYFKSFNYYENLPVGLDLMSSIEPKSGRNWGYRSKKYTYKKEDIPERLEFSFSTKSSEVFNGRPIIHTSPFVAQENKKNIQVPYFTDLQGALINPDDINKDSLIMLYGDLAGNVKYRSIGGISIQNGDLSWTYIHPTYYKDNAACELLNINGEATTANSVLKTKVQKISIPIDEFVPLRSILTALGDGRVASINENMLTGISDIELYHDI